MHDDLLRPLRLLRLGRKHAPGNAPGGSDRGCGYQDHRQGLPRLPTRLPCIERYLSFDQHLLAVICCVGHNAFLLHQTCDGEHEPRHCGCRYRYPGNGFPGFPAHFLTYSIHVQPIFIDLGFHQLDPQYRRFLKQRGRALVKVRTQTDARLIIAARDLIAVADNETGQGSEYAIIPMGVSRYQP
jgi:hypothetical protein